MDVLQGTLDLMVLQTLESMGPLHGYGIARRIEQISDDALKLNEGTVYASLMRLQHQRWISASWGASENNRKAKFYAITKAGRRQLVKETDNWDRIAGVMLGSFAARAGPDMWTTLVTLFSRLGFAWARRRLDDEARREFDAHLDLLVERYIRSGMTPAEARAAARRQLGNLTLAREEIYQLNGIDWIDALAQDLRYAFRQLRRSPGFSAVVIATLALGIGGTTAVFSVVQAVLLAPLPYEQPVELVRFYQQEPDNPATRHYSRRLRTSRRFASTPLRSKRSRALHSTPRSASIWSWTGRRSGSACCGSRATTSHTLRSGPLRGPGFDRGDEIGTRRVVLSDALWRTRFGSDPSVVGSTIQLSAEPYEVAGIAPQGFEDPIAGDVDAWLPYDLARRHAIPLRRTTR